MFIMIDNHDSFVYNLISYFKEENEEIEIVKDDMIDDGYVEFIRKKIKDKSLQGIIISPGPHCPKENMGSIKLLREFSDEIPFLGICLGHEIIGFCYGGKIVKAKRPLFGKLEKIYNDGKGIYSLIPSVFEATRYHSLVLDNNNLSENIKVTAWTKEKEIMGIEINNKKIYGIQFHPEALLTEYGHEIIRNFINICRENYCENIHKKTQ